MLLGGRLGRFAPHTSSDEASLLLRALCLMPGQVVVMVVHAWGMGALSCVLGGL